MAQLIANVNIKAQDPGNPEGYLKGYSGYIKGEKFTYHSAQPNVSESLLVRSMEKELYIEWETEAVPVDFNEQTAAFVFMACINVREEDPHSWDVLINDIERLTITTPSDRSLNSMIWTGTLGYELEFRPVMEDRYGDLHGYMFLKVPGKDLVRNRPLNIKVIGESSNHRAFFIVYRYGMEPGTWVVPEQAIRRDGKRLYQQVRINYTYLGDPVKVRIEAGDIKTETNIEFGYNSIEARLPVVSEATPFNVVLTSGGKKLAEEEFILEPVVARTIHLLHHSHVDIGYTHVQDDVKRIQWQHLENAIRLAKESQNNPVGARFRWNSEVMWALDSYLRENDEEKAEALKEAVRKGWIEPGAIFANQLSELCNTEELIRLTASARTVAREIGVDIESAMITDIPGWAWGLVPVLANSGVKYLSLGTNQGHRIGSIIEEWGDRPFWWVSPSGEEKILCWINEKGYSLFHTGVQDRKFKIEDFSARLFDYLNLLYERDYPYDIIPLRYSIGTDNGPTDPDLCDLVMEWNRKFETPVIRISTVSEAFGEFAEKHGEEIPSVRGAFTGYWEDGAASSAKETALNRQAAGNADIINSLAVITGMREEISGEVDELWRKVMLFDEHTWGSWNSISEPEDPFTLSQWAIKSSFAREAALSSQMLIERVAGIDPGWRSPERNNRNQLTHVEVVNTHSWDVNGAVEIPLSWRAKGALVKDENGLVVPSQRLSSGQIFFMAENVPALGSRVYFFEERAEAEPYKPSGGTSIENDLFRLTVDEETGSIRSLYDKTRKVELVDDSSLPGLNTYYYVDGRSPEKRATAGNSISTIIEQGDLISVIGVESVAPGCNSLVSYYTLIGGVDRVYVATVTDKIKTYDQEGVHLAFPFNVPDGEMFIDLALGAYRPEKGQPKGACKNYFTPERWVDISNQDRGITFITLDAPLIEIGDITTDATAYGWIDEIEPSQTLYSYIMNNYWETNYLAAQEGKVTFRYVIRSHDMFSASRAEKTALEESERLVVVPQGETTGGRISLFNIDAGGIIVTSLIPAEDGYLIRLFNSGGCPENLNITWADEPKGSWFTDFDGNVRKGFSQNSLIPAWGVRTLRVKNK